jgi:hydrogenase maturation protein HypF
MLDNGLDAPVLGVAWDGTGYGADGTIWGGEFLKIDGQRFTRVAHLAMFRLPGGEAAVRAPRRAALGMLYALYGGNVLNMQGVPPLETLSATERRLLHGMLSRGVNAPLTSSAGRLFDAVSSLLDLFQTASFEGEAAMAVEFAADRAREIAVLPPLAPREEGTRLVLDWRPMLRGLVDAIKSKVPPEPLAAALHENLASGIVTVAERIGIHSVLLTGGCFQNARLTECAVDRLRSAGFAPYWHHRIPPNDGGLAVGQAAYALHPLVEERN